MLFAHLEVPKGLRISLTSRTTDWSPLQPLVDDDVVENGVIQSHWHSLSLSKQYPITDLVVTFITSTWCISRHSTYFTSSAWIISSLDFFCLAKNSKSSVTFVYPIIQKFGWQRRITIGTYCPSNEKERKTSFIAAVYWKQWKEGSIPCALLQLGMSDVYTNIFVSLEKVLTERINCVVVKLRSELHKKLNKTAQYIVGMFYWVSWLLF